MPVGVNGIPPPGSSLRIVALCANSTARGATGLGASVLSGARSQAAIPVASASNAQRRRCMRRGRGAVRKH